MRLDRSTVDSPPVIPTTPLPLLFEKNKHDLPLPQSHSDDVSLLDTNPVNATAVELRIFSVIFSVFVLAISYFAVKAAVRTWKRRNADYLLTWAQNNQPKHSACKCKRPHATTPKLDTSSQLTTAIVKVPPDEAEPVATTGSPTTSSGVGTVDSSDASAETSSTNPLLELLSTTPTTSSEQPSPPGPSITVAEIALLSTNMAIRSSVSDAPIFHHHHLHHKRKGAPRRKRSSNSSPPSPVFPRRRPETDDAVSNGATLILNHRHRRNEPFGRQQHRHPRRKTKRRVSLDSPEERAATPPIVSFYLVATPDGDTRAPPAIPNSTNGLLASGVDREWNPPSRMWVDDDDDAGSVSIPLSVATAPPDYFDTMNAEWERQGFCPLYKSHRSRGTVTVPGTP